jgi:2-amino-4-hydroxy-6-hydroxymethyldihydropteridine diphosphokinase
VSTQDSSDPADSPELRRAFLGLGSNLGDRVQNLREAVETLRAVDLRAVSPVYETEPVGGPGGQGAYLNLVVQLETARSAHDLLGVCHRLESAAGRVRDERWGPRTLDVDVLWIDGVTVDDPDLRVPHPRMWERRFVLAPLRDLAPDLADAAAVEAASGYVEPVGELEQLAGRPPLDRSPER